MVVDNAIGSSGETEYNIYVLFGTGDNPYAEDLDSFSENERFFFYVYEDSDQKDEGTPCSQAELTWFYQLPAGTRVWASAFAAAGNLYFGTTSTDTDDPCEPKPTDDQDEPIEGSLFVFDLKTGSKKYQRTTGNIVTTPIVEDEHLYVKLADGSVLQLGSGKYNNEVITGGIGSTRIISWREVISR